MDIIPIDINHFSIHPISLWKDQWVLLTAGSLELKKFNSMTISWGSIGNMWNTPFAQVVVRPSRHTYQFINKFPDFTLCAFPEQYRKQLQNLGTLSGRDMDKINLSGFTPVKAAVVAAPAFEEAELVIECRKIFWQDFDPEHFLDSNILSHYPQNNFHRSYFGEILTIRGSDKYIV